MSLKLLGQAVIALAGSGLPGQSRPNHLPGLLRALRSTGRTPATLVAIAAVHRPDTPAVHDDQGTLSYRELDDQAARLAAGIVHRHGVPGSIAVLCRNHRGFLLATVAAGRLGADLIYLNTEFSAPQLDRVYAQLRPALVIADAEFLPRLAGVTVPVLTAWPTRSTVDDMVGEHSAYRPRQRVRTGTITILTSGTTGTPKGAARRPSALAMLGPLVTMLRRSRLRAGDPVLIAPPLFHGFGLAMWGLAITLRAPVVLRCRFDPEVVLADVARYRVAVLAAVPVMLQRILALPDVAAPTLHTVLSGAAPLRPELAQRFQARFGPVLFNGYGSSEIGIAAIATPADLLAAPGTVGRPTIGTPVRVLDPAGQPANPGVTGTIFVGGPLVFGGYTGGGSKRTVGRLMDTGDLGHLDAHGRLFVDGRTDDMIVSGGENVFPAEVEDVLARHPAILDAAVIGVADPEFGQRLVAYLVARTERPSAAELAGYVKDNLARYQVPRDFVFLPELPRNPTGKLLRAQLSTKDVS